MAIAVQRRLDLLGLLPGKVVPIVSPPRLNGEEEVWAVRLSSSTCAVFFSTSAVDDAEGCSEEVAQVKQDLKAGGSFSFQRANLLA